MLIMPDHYTPIALRTHSSEPVPFMLFSTKTALAYDSLCGEIKASKRVFTAKNPLRKAVCISTNRGSLSTSFLR